MPDTKTAERPKKRRQGKSKLASAVSGSLSGATVASCVQPLDVLRTRIQADTARGHFLSTVQTAQLLFKENGIAAFWRGTQPTVIRIAFGAGLNFVFIESVKPFFETQNKDGTIHMGAFGAAMTGGLSRAFAAMAACPITLVKTRMEYGGVGAANYKNTFDALSTIARVEGIRGLYSGIVPTVLSQAPFSAFYYMFYTKLKDKLKQEGQPPTTAVNFVSGTIAAVGATLITQPADVLRTRMQLGLAAAAAEGRKPSTLELFRQIAASQGTRGFMAGAAPRMLKRTLQTALVWTLYEELMPRVTKAKDWASGQLVRQP